MDEATSALDNESERLVQQSLEELTKGRTTLTIAHRLTTIKNATKILVLTEDGIEESGSHEELITKGAYIHVFGCKPIRFVSPVTPGAATHISLVSNAYSLTAIHSDRERCSLPMPSWDSASFTVILNLCVSLVTSNYFSLPICSAQYPQHS